MRTALGRWGERNPLGRHAGRLGSRRAEAWGLLAAFAAVAALAFVLQRYWLHVSLYDGLRPRFSTRWLTLALLSEAFLLLPWAAARGALGWRRLQLDGLLDEYRRTHLAPLEIALGALSAAIRPVAWFLALSLVMALGLALVAGQPTLARVALAHALLAAMALSFAALGQAGASGRRSWVAVPAAAALMLLAAVGILALNPFLRGMADPGPWIWWALLPNPVTAIGALLDVDVLRYPLIYELTNAHEYLFVYPGMWHTAGLYLALGAAAIGVQASRLARRES